MKIQELYSELPVILTNEEKRFVVVHGHRSSLSGMSEHDRWIAENLIRKGIYNYSHDRTHIVKEKTAKK
jgi:hypothetical protein